MQDLQAILKKFKRVAVVGISANESRPSHWIARDLWLQPGAQNPEAEERARDLGMTVVSGPCIYQELHH